jgi:molybdopterin-guanine dinucleotide biosynthesis protein A
MEMDAVVLAGEKEGAKLIRGTNKALLPLRGRPLISYVIEALAGAKAIREIYVVGPDEKLREGLKDFSFAKPLHFVPQKTNIFENIWTGFFATLPEDARERSSSELLGTGHADKPVFVITCDTPLMRPVEVDRFIEDADLEKNDLVLGVTLKEQLLPFAPKDNQPGIEFAYFCFREFIVRHSNIYIMRVLKFARVLEVYIPLVYGIRYQKQLRNIINAIAAIIRLGIGPKAIYIFIMFQIGRSLDASGRYKARDVLRRRLPEKMVLDYLSKVLQTRCAILLTGGPGPALDIDNEVDLETAEKMLDKWQEIHARILAGTYELPSP